MVEGLKETRSYVSHINQIADLGFNVIRLTLAGGCIREGVKPKVDAVNFTANPDLVVSDGYLMCGEVCSTFDQNRCTFKLCIC